MHIQVTELHLPLAQRLGLTCILNSSNLLAHFLRRRCAIRQQFTIPIIMQGKPIKETQMLSREVADIYMLSGGFDDVMGFGWATANANIAVLLQEGGGGGTLGKAMSLHMASVLPSHSAHLICLDDQYDEDIYSSKRIPTINGASPVPRGPGLGYEVDESEIRRMAMQAGSTIPRHIGVLTMADGSKYYGPSYLSPDQLTGKQEGTVVGFDSALWLADGSDAFEETFARLHPEDQVAEEDTRMSAKGVGGLRIVVTPTNGPTGHGNNNQATTPPFAIMVANPKPRL
jgi:hypothetical protein